MTFRMKSAVLAAAAAAFFLSGCGEKPAEKTAGAEKAAAPAAEKATEVAPVIIYSNADEEAQQAMKNALDANGFKGKYLMCRALGRLNWAASSSRRAPRSKPTS